MRGLSVWDPTCDGDLHTIRALKISLSLSFLCLNYFGCFLSVSLVSPWRRKAGTSKRLPTVSINANYNRIRIKIEMAFFFTAALTVLSSVFLMLPWIFALSTSVRGKEEKRIFLSTSRSRFHSHEEQGSALCMLWKTVRFSFQKKQATIYISLLRRSARYLQMMPHLIQWILKTWRDPWRLLFYLLKRRINQTWYVYWTHKNHRPSETLHKHPTIDYTPKPSWFRHRCYTVWFSTVLKENLFFVFFKMCYDRTRWCLRSVCNNFWRIMNCWFMLSHLQTWS